LKDAYVVLIKARINRDKQLKWANNKLENLTFTIITERNLLLTNCSMRSITLLALLLILLSCQNSTLKNQERDVEALSTDELRFTTFAWYYPKGKWEFYVQYTLLIDKKGHFDMMMHDTLENRKMFYKGALNDTILRMINTILVADTFNTDYRKEQLYNIAYSGLTYCLELKKDSINKRIIFIQRNSPSDLKILSDMLINLINTVDCNRVDTIDFSKYLYDIQESCITSMGPPPKIIISEKWEPGNISE
jgi:hypothetical protein